MPYQFRTIPHGIAILEKKRKTEGSEFFTPIWVVLVYPTAFPIEIGTDRVILIRLMSMKRVSVKPTPLAAAGRTLLCIPLICNSHLSWIREIGKCLRGYAAGTRLFHMWDSYWLERDSCQFTWLTNDDSFCVGRFCQHPREIQIYPIY